VVFREIIQQDLTLRLRKRKVFHFQEDLFDITVERRGITV
jgi:hypothetical protein